MKVLFTLFLLSAISQNLFALPLLIEESINVPYLGEAQGLEFRDDRLYLFGERNDVGVIREHLIHGNKITYTGREILLKDENGVVMPHPTGLTFDARHGTFIGNTKNGIGILYKIDWQKALEQGNLKNGAVLAKIPDTAAKRGSRPEVVTYKGKTYLASSDYGDSENEVRLYDFKALQSAKETKQKGVIAHSFPCGPWVQSLHFIERSQSLILVQNTKLGKGWRLSFLQLAASIEKKTAVFERVADLAPTSGLEGFHLVSSQRALALTNQPPKNLNWVRLMEGLARVKMP